MKRIAPFWPDPAPAKTGSLGPSPPAGDLPDTAAPFSLSTPMQTLRSMMAALAALALLAPAGAAQSALTNQRLYDTIPNLPEVYAERVARFEREPVATGRVIFLGNSITQGADWARLLGDSTVVNRGIGGDITYGVLKRLDDVVRRQPSKLFILLGINDIGKDIPDAVIADNFRQIIERVRAGSPATRVYVQSILPVNPGHPGFPQHYDKQARVRAVNRLLKRVAAATGVHFLDVAPALMDSRRRLDARFTTDGLHLNEQGYQAWVARLRRLGAL